jgi:hypothetical protein
LPRAATALANNGPVRRIRRRLFALLPFPVLRSDVRDVIYANWLVPLDRLQPHLPIGTSVFAPDGQALVTVLTYRHGHFGPEWAGPLRRLFPSPLQSNWRAYVTRVDGQAPAKATVLFLRNIFDSLVYALGTRVFSDALPSHQAAKFELSVDPDAVVIDIDGGTGSAPAMRLTARAHGSQQVPERFQKLGMADGELLAKICLQDAALAETDAGLAEAWIDLPIDLAKIQGLETAGYTPGELLKDLGAIEAPWCFRIPAVRFTVLGETLRRPA